MDFSSIWNEELISEVNLTEADKQDIDLKKLSMKDTFSKVFTRFKRFGLILTCSCSANISDWTITTYKEEWPSINIALAVSNTTYLYLLERKCTEPRDSL